jgi:hypothetical protein
MKLITTLLILLLFACSPKFISRIENKEEKNKLKSFLLDSTRKELSLFLDVKKTKKVFSVETCKVLDVIINTDSNFYIIITRGKYYTGYSNLSECYVKKGEQIKINSLIGKVDAKFSDDIFIQFFIKRPP